MLFRGSKKEISASFPRLRRSVTRGLFSVLPIRSGPDFHGTLHQSQGQEEPESETPVGATCLCRSPTCEIVRFLTSALDTHYRLE